MFFLARFADADVNCTFCKNDNEALTPLFFSNCTFIATFWFQILVIIYHKLMIIVNVMIRMGTFLNSQMSFV